MSALSLYHRSPLWAQTAALTAYGFRLKWLRSGSVRRGTLQELRRSQWWSAQELQALQSDRLGKLVAYTAATVPFYKRFWRDPTLQVGSVGQLGSLPLLTKEDVRLAGKDMISLQAPRRLTTIHTGGTTGKPLTVYCDRPALQRNYAFYDRLREWAGVPSGRVATFAGRPIVRPEQDRPPFWRRNLAARALLCSSYHLGPATAGAYVAALAAFEPQYIDSYPSSIVPLARYLQLHPDPRPHPKAIITSSETLAPEDRAVIEGAFQCPVFDHYGSAEMVAFITQCEKGTYHVNSEYGVVEILVDGRPALPGEIGDVVATGFVNPVMPLIRYQTGDRAERGDDRCPCGRMLPTLRAIVGRQDDVIQTPEGRFVGRLDPIFKAVDGLLETRIVQDRLDHVRVEMVAAQSFSDQDAANLERELRLRLGPTIAIELTKVPKIPRTAGGKLRAVVNLLPKHTSAC